MRLWLAGLPPANVFAEVSVSFLDRPPAFDEAINRRLEALAALAGAYTQAALVVSSRRAITRQTISREDLVDSTVVLKPGQGPDPVVVAARLVELGYVREPLVEERGQFSLRGGILDVFPSAADAPVRAEWSGDVVETLRLFDPENQRSVMPVRDVTIRTGRELLIGPERGRAAVERLRQSVTMRKLRGDVRSEWEDDLTRLEAGAAFAGVEFYAAYLDPSRPSLLDHLPEGAVVIDVEPGRQLAGARTLLDEAAMLAAAEAGGGAAAARGAPPRRGPRPSRRRAARPACAPSRRAEHLTGEFTLASDREGRVGHAAHGTARFKGMGLIEWEGAPRESLELESAEGDRLFVPVENLDRVQKYLGGAEGTPALHRLGTSDWTRARGRARKVVQDVAEDLLKVYSMREARPGIAFAPDTAWQQELESSFPYEETPDQVAALAEIKADMESDRPMDRLLCGDVGFGKTELALRPAFKAAMSGKQVALLAPTTVLAQQHFHVFRERLKNFPVVVEMLSRFVADETQARTVEGLKSGHVDIVVGTHRLLQRDWRFSRLGLLVLAESHGSRSMQKEGV